jgi:hypothetical protein
VGFAAGVMLGLAACRSGEGRATADQPAAELPAYDREAARVFDDSIAPEVFGLQVDREDPNQDPLFIQRCREADHVSRVKLRTIREERFDGALRYRIVVQPLGPALAGEPLKDELELNVGRASPSLSMLRSMSVEAVGAKFILFLKRYQLDQELVFHFRGEPDRETIVQAIRRANAPTP